MSWDVCVLKADSYRSVRDLPKAFEPPALGSIAEIKEKLAKVYPTIVWSQPDPDCGLWGSYKDESEKYSIEFSLGTKDHIEAIMLYVRGGGSVVSKIVALCVENGWAAIDTSVGEFMDLKQPSTKGWEDFQSFRDRVIKR
jgi:hypothetical protein